MCRGLFGIIGPSMIGPSSSHTAGAVRIGRMCLSISGKDIVSVTFFLHGSFAKTYRGHGTDRALVGGLLGMETDDERIINSLEIAQNNGIAVKFIPTDLGNVHPNTVKAEMETKSGETFNLVASSIGGGEIKIISINGFHANISGNYNSIIVKHVDKVGMISKITHVFELANLNIVSLYNNREDKGKTAITIIEMDGDIDDNALKEIPNIDGVCSLSVVHKF